MFLIPLGLTIASCDDDVVVEESGETVIIGIKIINGGAGGNQVLVGTVDENKKEINFPEIDPATDLSKVRFETQLSTGATMDEDAYDFTIEEGRTSLTRVIAVVNGKRKREYFATIRLDLPVWGADFSDAKMKVYDYSGRTSIYPDLAGANTRCADMDINYVLMVSREGGNRPHLLSMADIKDGGNLTPILLDVTGVSGGTFAVSAGNLAQGHIYICNLATPSATAALKIYHWADKDATPELVGEIFGTDLVDFGAGRFGDYMSTSLNADGNGFMFFGVNGNQAAYKLLRVKVTNFTTLSDPTLVNVTTYAGMWAACNQVDGSPDDYLYSGHQGALMLINASGQIQYTIPAASIPINEGSDAYIITFNKERYMVMMATPGAGSVNIYDLTLGTTTVDALTIWDAGNKNALRKYSLGGSIAAATASGSIGWAKDGDETLYIMGAGPGAGFVVLEFPKKVKENQ
jgi:hypothetical protein